MAFGPIIGDAAAAFALITPTGQRSIGTIFPDVAVEEIHRDEMQITVHPVETGTPVTDHSFLMPQTVELRWFWSNSSAQAEGFVQAIYQQLLALQQSRQPQTISTGKRQYTSMLIRSILVRTDPETEFALALIAVAQQLITTSVTTTAGSSPNSNGSSSIGNVADNPSASTIAAQADAAGGADVDSQGNVSFPNAVAPGGFVSVSPVVASSFGQTSNSLLAVLPPP
jgi:hypothetical protein